MNHPKDNKNWMTIIREHRHEASNPNSWLEYSLALLQTTEIGADTAKAKQQIALALEQAKRDGATPDEVADCLQTSLLMSLVDALELAGVDHQMINNFPPKPKALHQKSDD